MPSVNEINMNNVTSAIWLKRPQSTDRQELISKPGVFALSCNDKQLNVTIGTAPQVSIPLMPKDDNWHHIVLTISDKSVTLYIDARKVWDNSELAVLANNSEENIQIDQANSAPDFLHRITFFHRALPADEILQLYRRGKEKPVQDLSTATGDIFDYDNDTLKSTTMPIQIDATAPSLRDTPSPVLPSVYPFTINMTNGKDSIAPAIYILSDFGGNKDIQDINFEIKNTSADAYQVGTFTLSFRRGTLHEDLTKNNAKQFCDILKAAVKIAFTLSAEPTVTLEETGGNINFMVNAESNNFSFPAITSVIIKLSGIYAAPGTGTRTSGYEVKFEDVQKVVGTNPSGAVFSFGRNAVLQVINHQGVSYAPVHFGVLGNNFLLNGQGGQNIAIFMQSLNGTALEISKDTKFIFGFYASETSNGSSVSFDGGLAFGNRSEVDAISVVTPPPPFKLAPQSHVDEHGRRDITFVTDVDRSASFLAFNFNNIALSGNSGLVKVHVEVENLPGYWDSNFEVTFIKGPMVMAEGQVGIGTLPVRKNALSVKGDTYLDGNLDIYGYSVLQGGTTIQENLTVGGNTDLFRDTKVQGDTLLRGDATLEKGLTVQGGTNLKGDTTLDKALTVMGDTHLKGNLDISGNLTFNAIPSIQIIGVIMYKAQKTNDRIEILTSSLYGNISSISIALCSPPPSFMDVRYIKPVATNARIALCNNPKVSEAINIRIISFSYEDRCAIDIPNDNYIQETILIIGLPAPVTFP